MSLSIIFGADLVPTESNFDLFISGEIEKLIDEKILNSFFGADYRILNLEVPLCDTETPIIKAGPVLRAPCSCVNGIKKLNPSLLTLANNHTRDHNVRGLLNTFETLDKAQINYMGAGETPEIAKEPYIIEDKGMRIGIYACAEHEFSIVEKDMPGVNPFDPFESLDHIEELKKICDYVVVLYHGGKEHFRYPSPRLKKTCRKLIDKGADLVLCQHTHCVGCFEEYKGKTAIYGQGNFLFDLRDNEMWQTGMLVKVEFGDKINLSYIPLVKNGNGIRTANETEEKEIIGGFLSRSKEILNDGVVEEKYLEICKKQLANYMYWLAGKEQSGKEYSDDFGENYPKEYLARIYNYIICEVHNESITYALWDTLCKENNKPERGGK